MGKWVNLLLVITVTLSVEQLEKRDHDNRCYVGCRKEPPHVKGWSYKLGKKWVCRCVTDFEESDLLALPFSLSYGKSESQDQPEEDPWTPAQGAYQLLK
jgi:hypothetical protein